MWVCVRGKHSFTADVRKADWCTILFSFLCWFLSLLLLLPSLAVPSSLSAVWAWRGQMSCYVTGNAAVREVKLYFSLKGVFFSCQQAWLHPWLPLPISIFSLIFLCFFFFLASLLPPSLFLSSSLLSGAVQRTDWGYYFSATEFFCHAVILKVPLCSCVQDKSKTFFYSCNQCPSRFSTALPFPHLRHICRHVHTLKTHIHTLSLLCFFLRRWFSLERWHQIASLQQSTPLGGICIVFASHYRFNRANCAPSWVKMMRGEVERWR